MPRILLSLGVSLAGAIALAACTNESEAPARGYDVPMRSDTELEIELTSVCQKALEHPGQPVLVEFSAAWCSDCQKLGQMKQAKALASEISEWPSLTVNVGQFDRHREILDAMRIRSIAHWAVLQPTSCLDSIDLWERVADRTLEVSSGEARTLTPADLARWLRGFRPS